MARAEVTPERARERTNDYWVELDRKYRIQARPTEPLVLERGQGVRVWDVEGHEYMDFESGQFCMATGHTHPSVAQALREQADRLMHTSMKYLNIPRIRLAQKLAAIAPAPLQQSYFGCAGSEANEAALRLAKKYTGRFEIVAVLGGYHGRSLASASVSTSYMRDRAGYGPMMAGTTYIPAPYCYRCPFNETYPGCRLSCAQYGEEVIDRTTSGEPAALIMELIIGSGGVIVPPPEWVRRIRQMCDERGMLLIDDEALTGVGRTGRWFACQHFDVVPDILTTSKALGGGVPLCAVITTAEIAAGAVRKGYDQAASHMGDPFQCAVGLANLEVVERENLVDRAAQRGAQLKDGLQELSRRHEIIGDVRGLGLLVGIEIVESKASKRPAPQMAARVTDECRRRGLLIGGPRLGARMGLNALRLSPPFIATQEDIARALSVMDAALEAAAHAAVGHA